MWERKDSGICAKRDSGRKDVSIRNFSKSGPTNRMRASRKGERSDSTGETGQSPRRCRPLVGVFFVVLTINSRVMVVVIGQASVTARMRARMTDGPSRLRVGEGRVDGKR